MLKQLTELMVLIKVMRFVNFFLESIRKHRSDGYNYLHIGLIQVAVKPIFIKGINASVLLCLRDARFLDFPTSMLGVMESGLHDGPVHFNCYPDFTLSLSDPHILKALTLNIKTAGQITNMHDGSHTLALIYRIYYKCIKSNLNVHALVKSPKDKTLLIQSSSEHANIQIPKTILWKDIELPSHWMLDNENHSSNFQHSKVVDLDHVQQLNDGKVRISFDEQRFRSSVKIRDLDSPSSKSSAIPHSSHISRHDMDLLDEIG